MVYDRYFERDDISTVLGVLEEVVGYNLQSCSRKLAQFMITSDYRDTDLSLACPKATAMGELRGYDSDNPVLIVCPAALEHGSFATISNIPGAPGKLTCDSVSDGGIDRTTWRMTTVGQTLFHEYAHWKDFYTGVLRDNEGIEDVDQSGDEVVYGVYEVQQLRLDDGAQSVLVADSYAWFATEAFWTRKCKKSGTVYQPAIAGDAKDPDCDGQQCTETHPRGAQS